MKPGQKFLLGAAIIVGAVALLMIQGVKEFGQYSLTPSELAAKTAADSSFYNLGLKMNAKVVPGTIKRDQASQTIDFEVTDGSHTYPVSYHGLAPDTFTDQQDIEVVVEGRLGRDGVFRATTLLAKCGSRYSGTYKDGQKV
jgi:cytochrome c-type biogenesis protein CcmE